MDEEDYIDSNYIWQRRISRVLHNSDISSRFPYAAALGVEFNPAFERSVKIPVDLLVNGVILDIHNFVRTLKKVACHHLFDILHFNFDLGLSSDSPECFNFAYTLYRAIKFCDVARKFRKYYRTFLCSRKLKIQSKCL
ncbi:hypothetical protein WMY93_007314 [Mugilogobius chulae]|uniref:Uncharacterized protein n=1 Tax=Mugilogobius chulae TaxID=88201 RepID=A0AAW0PRA5_9GOBI